MTIVLIVLYMLAAIAWAVFCWTAIPKYNDSELDDHLTNLMVAGFCGAAWPVTIPFYLLIM